MRPYPSARVRLASANWPVQALLCLLLALFSAAACPHPASTAYLNLAGEGADNKLQWRIALQDLDTLLKIDADADGRFTWDEAKARERDVLALAAGAIGLSHSGGPCDVRYAALQRHQDGSTEYGQLDGQVDCGGQRPTRLAYRLFEGVDDTHRVLVRVGDEPAEVLQPGAVLPLQAGQADAPHSFGQFVREGIGHILGGLDHLLFLITLMLPAVVKRDSGRWTARLDRRQALIQVAWTATAFTLAHSVTLGLASFGLVRIDADIVEPLIAVTVLLAALNNLRPVVLHRVAWMAFFFGLIHGFGFAEVLAPLELPRADLAAALFGFNLGVEIGQLAVVVVSFLLLAAAARWQGYPRWILQAGSGAVGLLALLWIVERTTGLAPPGL